MKRTFNNSQRLLYPVCLTVVILSSILLLTGCHPDQFKHVNSTDLGNENLNGISLMEKCDVGAIEKAFGKSQEVVFKDTNTDGYSFNSEVCDGAIAIDKNNNIISIAASTIKDNLRTSRGITSNKSSFDDIVKAYGNNYLKVIEKNDEPGAGGPKYDGYTVTYIDKIHNYKLEFSFDFSVSDQSKGKLQLIRLWRGNDD